MISPAYKNRIKKELVDRARHLAKTRGEVDAKFSKTTTFFRLIYFYRLGPLRIRCTVGDDHVTIHHYARVSGKLQLALTCGKPYRFGRQQAKVETLQVLLDLMRQEMVLDDLANTQEPQQGQEAPVQGTAPSS